MKKHASQHHVVFSTKKVAKRTQQQQQSGGASTRLATQVPPPATVATVVATAADTGAPTATTPRSPTVTTADSGGSARTEQSTVSRRHRDSSNTTTASNDSHSNRSHSSQRRRKSSSSKQRLKPASALLQSDQISVAQCVRHMIAKKTDATLLLDQNGLLTGILTDRDIAFKVVALNKNPSLTRVCDVMTRNPSCVASSASAIDALRKMVSGQFRHLPVTDNNKVVGILDIAKCLYDAISKIEHGYELSPERLSEAIKKLERQITGVDNLFETLRQKLFLPTLSALLTDGAAVPIVRPTSTALDAAKLMLETKTSAVMVCRSDTNEMLGIFTTKDLMRRVVGLDLDPLTTRLADVMTSNPHAATLSTTILETLHSMHNGQFLHMPVFDADNTRLVGLVDVLQVTCGVVQQMGSFQQQAVTASTTTTDTNNVQPLWQTFRNSLHDATTDALSQEDDDIDSDVRDSVDSQDATTATAATVAALTIVTEKLQPRGATNATSDTHAPAPTRRRLVIDGQTWDEFVASHQLSPFNVNEVDNELTSDATAIDNTNPALDDDDNDNAISSNTIDTPPLADSSTSNNTPNVFVYKLADCYGTNYRFTSSAESLSELLRDVQSRLGDSTIKNLHYVDDDGDHVLLFKDDDLKDAVARAKTWGQKYIKLLVPHRTARISDRASRATRRVFAHGGGGGGTSSRNDSALGIVYYAAAAAAIAGASFFLSRRK